MFLYGDGLSLHEYATLIVDSGRGNERVGIIFGNEGSIGIFFYDDKDFKPILTMFNLELT